VPDWAWELGTKGPDTLATVVDFGHAKSMEVFWSMRMNDTHDSGDPALLCRWKKEHPEWLMGKRGDSFRAGGGRWSAVNYGVPEVREKVFRILRDVATRYDVDGLDLDFFRHPVYFKPQMAAQPVTRQHRDMMTDLLRRVRAMADQAAAQRGRPVLIAVRVPDSVEYCAAIGLDVVRWLAEDLVDLLMVSCYFQLNPWETSVRLGHQYGVPVYPCLSEPRYGLRESQQVRQSLACFRGRALDAWNSGADGIYLFNCFDPHSALWRELGDRRLLESMERCYPAGTMSTRQINAWLADGMRWHNQPIPLPERALVLDPGRSGTVEIRVAEQVRPVRGVQPLVTARLLVVERAAAGSLGVALNGQPLGRGVQAGPWWELPVEPSLVRSGINRLEISLAPGGGQCTVQDAVLAIAPRQKAAAAPAPNKPVEEAIHLDTGGYSANVPEVGRPQSHVGENLLADGGFEKLDAGGNLPEHWTKSFHVYTGPLDEQRGRELRQLLSPLAEHEISTVRPHSGSRCVRLVNPVRMSQLRSQPALHFTSSWRQRIVLPEARADAKYVFSVFTRGRAEPGVEVSRARVVLECVDTPAYHRNQRQLLFTQDDLVLGHHWQRNEIPFIAPRGTRAVLLSLHLDNCGEAWFDDAALHRGELDDGVVMRLLPGFFMDNRFCLSCGDPAVMLFGFRNEAELKINRPLAVIELPEGVEVLDTRNGVRLSNKRSFTRDGCNMVCYEFDIKSLARIIQKDHYSSQYGLSLLVRTDLPAGTPLSAGRYWFADGSYPRPAEFAIDVLPPIRGQRPARFQTAAMFTPEVTEIGEPGAVRALADFYVRAGFSAAHVEPSPLAQALGEKKITRYWQPYWLCNGYRLGAGRKPDSAAFRLADGTFSADGICPVEVYGRGPYFRQSVVEEILRKAIVLDRSTEHIMPNWEPFMYKYKGCFCDRCREDFVRFTKLPAAEVAKAWPQHVLRDYRDTWIRFRSWQHGRLVQTLEEETSRLGREAGIESHFIPEVCAEMVMAESFKHEAWRQFAAADFLDKLPVVQPWEGYCSLNMFKPYAYTTGFHLKALAIATGVRSFVDNSLLPEQRPRLIQLVHSRQGESWVATPEGITQDMLSHFLEGWHGAFAYVFPRGYDARYWAALAKANSLIARFEPFVSRGARTFQHKIEPQTPLPRPHEKWTCQMKSDKILYSWEFRKGPSRLLAVGNYWEKGECFFRLAVEGLQAGTRWVLREPAEDRTYGKAPGVVPLSAADLANGVLLHVGAARTAFFLLEPYVEGGAYGAIVVPTQMQREMSARLPAIKQAWTWEQQFASDS
jgi:hypothetical protein